MAAIRTVDQIAAKWASVTPLRSADYETGIREPRKDWQVQTAAASDAWKAGVTAAIARDGFKKGVTKAGTSAWTEGALEKGLARWGPGVALAQDRYMTAFSPYVEAIKRLTLPPRYARRDPRNLERVKAVVDAMIAAKISLQG